MFKPAESPRRQSHNEAFRKAMSGGPDWWDKRHGAYREAMASGRRGETRRRRDSARARTIEIDGKGGHKVTVRVIAPERAKGVYMHIHGGGLVFGSAANQDPMLERIVASMQWRA